MKISASVLLAIVLAIALIQPAFGQKSGIRKSTLHARPADLATMMGKPAFISTADSFVTKIWIISQRKHKDLMKSKDGSMMSAMKDRNMVIDMESKAAVMTGTHYLICEVRNAVDGAVLPDSSAKVEIVSPTKQMASVNLLPMKGHFGSGVSLKEHGEYLFTVSVSIGTGYSTTQFKYRTE